MNPADATSERRSLRTTAADKFFVEDLHDIFATLINSLTLHPSKHFFKTIENTFTTEEAIQDLSVLRLCQTNRTWDLNNKPIITSTTTTYSMEYEAAMSICQQCMDARLIENAIEPASGIFKPRGIWSLTPKGLHILERFVTMNGMETEDLQSVFTLQPILIKMLHLERHPSTNEIVISNQVIIALFKRFAGRQPNYSSHRDLQSTGERNVFREYYERYKGITVSDVQDKSSPLFGKKPATHKMCFGAVEALTWLTDFTSIGARDEAAVMAAHFVRFGFIVLAIEKSKTESVTVTVRGAPSHGKGFTAQTGEFRCANKTLYKITELGTKVLGWDDFSSYTASPQSSQSNLSGQTPYASPVMRPKNLQRRLSTADNAQNIAHDQKMEGVKESNTERLQYILDNPALLSLFREYLVSTLCDENLSFYMDVEELKRKYRTSSSAPKSSQESRSTVDKHRETLASMAWHVHSQYLAPSSPCELNIDHTLRSDIGARMDQVFDNRPRDPLHTSPGQIQEMIGLYNRIQQHVFRLMASDSVPKFTDTPRFQHHRREVGDLDINLFGEHGAIQETISIQAAEQQARSPHFGA